MRIPPVDNFRCMLRSYDKSGKLLDEFNALTEGAMDNETNQKIVEIIKDSILHRLNWGQVRIFGSYIEQQKWAEDIARNAVQSMQGILNKHVEHQAEKHLTEALGFGGL